MWTWLEIDSNSLRSNVQEFQKILTAQRCAFVLKSNAYGHGLKECYTAIADLNLPLICTNYVTEALTLRDLGYRGRLMIVGPFVVEDLKAAYDYDLELFLGHLEGLEAWIKLVDKPKLHIEFDTGMSRQGFAIRDLSKVVQKLSPFSANIKGLAMHFANVEDVNEHSYADLQLEKFDQVVKHFKAESFQVEVHAASSASALILENSRFDICRVGISMYGFWPSVPTKISYAQINGKSGFNLKPVLSWKTIVTSINEIGSGQFVGYGCTYRARKAMKVAILPVGYFEGYPRLASGTNAYVLIRGQRCPIVGRICMNMMMVDVSDVESVAVEDIATLIGQDGQEAIQASDIGAWSQTIHYEIVTRLNPLLPKKVI
ncbi:MAG: alanine racemase [Proteobacteria bacterium]|nr:alanine racemase [Pseudomonadota bacterium]